MSTSTSPRAASPRPPPLTDFEEVYETYFDFVWSNMRRLGVAPAQVDDAVQDLFLAVHRRLPEFEGRASMKTWLFHFILRVAATHRRASRGVDNLKVRVDVGPAATPDRQVETRQAAELLYRLLDELEDSRRAVFVLVELEELSLADAARALGMNVNTAYSKLRDARRDFEQAVTRESAREDWRGR